MSLSTQGKLLARHFKNALGVSITHTQALEALASLQNEKSFNVLKAKSRGNEKPAATVSDLSASDLLQLAIDKGLDSRTATTVFAKRRTPMEKAYAFLASEQFTAEGTLEFDENALVSVGSDPGVYVQGWSWVPLSMGDVSLSARFLLGGYTSMFIIDPVTHDELEVAAEQVNFTSADVMLQLLKSPKAVPAETLLAFVVSKDSERYEFSAEAISGFKWDGKKEVFKGMLNGKPVELYFEFEED